MKISASEQIKAPKAAVFAVFSDIPKVAERIEGITKLELLSEVAAGKGVRWRETRVMFGKEASEEMEITAFDAPSSYVVEAESHGVHYTSRYDFAETEGGTTRVTWEFEGKPVTFLARLMSPLGILFKGATEKMMKQDVLDLKRHLEA